MDRVRCMPLVSATRAPVATRRRGGGAYTARMPPDAPVQVVFADPAMLLAGGDALPDALDEDDRRHVARLRHARDRTVAGASRLVQRLAVARAAGHGPQAAASLRFVRDANGRPRVDAPAALQGWHFSASNAHGLVGCAVARAPLGLDVEPLARALAPELLAHCCTAGERDALQALAPDARPAAFFRLWTRKEAYLKARGLGLSIEPARVELARVDARRHAVRLDGCAQAAGAWQVLALDAGPAHAASLCVPAGAVATGVEIAWARRAGDGVVFGPSAPHAAG